MVLQRLNDAISHRESGQFDDAHKILMQLLADEPDNPLVNYQLAWLCDVQGKESDAIPYYEHAIHNGLEGEDMRGAMLGLTSTYRCLGRYAESVDTCRKGMIAFPDAREFPIFLAMALYNAGEHAESMRLLLSQLVETTCDGGILAYKQAIMYYHDKLDQVWD